MWRECCKPVSLISTRHPFETFSVSLRNDASKAFRPGASSSPRISSIRIALPVRQASRTRRRKCSHPSKRSMTKRCRGDMSFPTAGPVAEHPRRRVLPAVLTTCLGSGRPRAVEAMNKWMQPQCTLLLLPFVLIIVFAGEIRAIQATAHTVAWVGLYLADCARARPAAGLPGRLCHHERAHLTYHKYSPTHLLRARPAVRVACATHFCSVRRVVARRTLARQRRAGALIA